MQISQEEPRKFKTSSYDSSNIENESVPVIEEPFTTESIPEINAEPAELKDINDNPTHENDPNTESILGPVSEFPHSEEIPHLMHENDPFTEPIAEPDQDFPIYEEIPQNTSEINSQSEINENSEQNDADYQTIEDDLVIHHSELDDSVDNYDSVIEEEEFIDETVLKKKLDVDRKIKEIIQQKNFDEMGNFILQGCGEYLINEKSSHPEIQEFINNLPIYLVSVFSSFAQFVDCPFLFCYIFV